MSFANIERPVKKVKSTVAEPILYCLYHQNEEFHWYKDLYTISLIIWLLSLENNFLYWFISFLCLFIIDINYAIFLLLFLFLQVISKCFFVLLLLLSSRPLINFESIEYSLLRCFGRSQYCCVLYCWWKPYSCGEFIGWGEFNDIGEVNDIGEFNDCGEFNGCGELNDISEFKGCGECL